MREKVGKSRSTVFFQWFVAPEGRKVGSLKRRVRSQLARWEMKNCTPLWREAHLEVKMYKAHQVRTTFGSWDVEKVHAVVARSTFPSQNVQDTRGSDHFWKLRCRKSARRCGAKHISKSKCTKHTMLGPLLEVEMSKKCTPLWREAHFQVKMYKSQNVQNNRGSDHFWKLRCRKSARRCGAKHISKSKMYKTHHARTTFGSWDVEKVYAVVARSTFPSQNVQNTPGSDHFWKLRCRKSARRCGAKHISKSKCIKHTMLGPLLEVEMSKKCTPLWREAHFQVKMYKSQNVQNNSDHFWKLRCRKSARRCGAKHISKSKCTKHTMLGPLLEVEMSKKCTPLWREAHFQVKMYKSQNVQNTTCSRHFWRFGCWKSARRRGAKHISKSKCTKHRMFAPLLEVRILYR